MRVFGPSFFYKYLQIKKDCQKMEKITSNQVVGLMEAYNAVYTPQINEEQVWEEVETWVNSLLEEGYDLSEYTWEEMYEAYIAEAGVNFGGQKAVDAVKAKSAQQQQSASKLDAQRAQRFGAGSYRTASPTPTAKAAPAKYKSSSDGKTYANYNDALAAKNSRTKGLAVQQGIEKTFKAGGGNAAVAQGKSPLAVVTQGSTNLQRQQRPAPAAAPAARPAAAAPAAKAAPAAAPAAKPAPTAATAPTTTPSKPSLASGISDIKDMQKKSQARQASMLNQSFDVFDVVLGHLIGEGYADTEEAATAIMANMSEDWRESILEEVLGEDAKYDRNRKRAAERAARRNAARDAGQTGAVPGVGYVTPRRERETYTDSAGTERHKSGARMPEKKG
jgi:hypothetical protein